MPDQIAALGDIVDGTLLAGAAEPETGADRQADQKICLNCGTELIGPYCHGCGQAAHVHRHLMAFFHDLAHGVFHFEGKVWRTLPMLAWRPGELTREYIDGRRARYVSPIALFLFSVFLLFAAVNLEGEHLPEHSTVTVNGKSITGLAANEAELARLQAQRAAMVAQHKSTADIDDLIRGREQGIKVLRQFKDPASAMPTPSGSATHYTKLPGLDAAIERAKANPQLAMLRIEESAHKFSWLLIPLSVPLVWLLFPFNRRFGLYDHTVFVTYSLCFMILLQTAVMLAGAAGLGWLAVVVLYAPVHMYRQLRGAYGLTRRGALWRVVVLWVFAWMVLALWIVAMLALGLTG